MKNCLFFALVFWIGGMAWAQEWEFSPPNYDQIKTSIANESSPLYYETLMTRFHRGDTSLTLEEKRHLYYGYPFQKTYAPYSHSTFQDSLQVVLSKPRHEMTDLDAIIHYGEELLKENPFDLMALSYQLYALEQQGDQEAFMPKLSQFRIVVEAMLSSGDGVTKDTAFYVIQTDHEYVLIEILGLSFGGTQSLIEHYDYLTLAENNTGLEGMYFDVSVCLEAMSKWFGE